MIPSRAKNPGVAGRRLRIHGQVTARRVDNCRNVRLTDIDLAGLGAFTESECSFRVSRYNLEEPWSYIYVTRKILLRLDQRGVDCVQLEPPGGTVLIRRERFQKTPSLLVWIRTGGGRAFANFWGPTVGLWQYPELGREFHAEIPHCARDDRNVRQEPEEFSCEYTPAGAIYSVKYDSILCETELFVPPDEAVVVMTCRVTNTDARARRMEAVPTVRPHLAAASLAPWDVPALYQTVAYSNEIGPLFSMELRSPSGLPEERRYAFAIFDIERPDAAEVDYARYIGRGTFENPEGVPGIPCGESFKYGEETAANSCRGVPGIIALCKRIALAPGESFDLAMVLGSARSERPGAKPTLGEIASYRRFFDLETREASKKAYAESVRDLVRKRSISTPDPAFSRYVNEWLPLQLNWVHVLDRGWPTGMRGVRDSAQDGTALIALDPAASGERIIELFSIQRSDGWFPRQYSVRGRHGQHDLRRYVDGGVWVWELLFDYLRRTKDLGILERTLPYLDSDCEESVLDHALRLIDYYLADSNLGEHGLCLIREGDWNDSINRAGLEGRGESVMVSCQVVLVLRQAAYLLGRLPGQSERASDFSARADALTSSILRHALNTEGYLNGVFTDNGEWVFSPADPDGRRRVSVPANAWGIISGVLKGEAADRALDVLVGLKQRDGWPLFHPPIGDPPIRKLGRIGQGDLLPGLGENGTPYNHGSHGFLGRAAACAGRGDLLLEVLRYMLPYDQRRHPVERAKTAPYAVVNHWKAAPGLEGRGGDAFLTGSISTALRNVYDGLFGIKPLLDCLAFDPCLPSEWDRCLVKCTYRGRRLEIAYAKGEPRVDVDGRVVSEKTTDWLGKTLPAVPDAALDGDPCRIEIAIGG